MASGEELSPAGKMLLEPSMNCYVIATIGLKTRIDPQVIREGLSQTLLKHSRFTSKLVSNYLSLYPLLTFCSKH